MSLNQKLMNPKFAEMVLTVFPAAVDIHLHADDSGYLKFAGSRGTVFIGHGWPHYLYEDFRDQSAKKTAHNGETIYQFEMEGKDCKGGFLDLITFVDRQDLGAERAYTLEIVTSIPADRDSNCFRPDAMHPTDPKPSPREEHIRLAQLIVDYLDSR